MKKYILAAALLLTACSQARDSSAEPALPDVSQTEISQGSETQSETVTSSEGQADPVSQIAAPLLSHKSGFYEKGFMLEMTAPEGCTVYYTTDGSTPTVKSKVYTEPVKLIDRTPEANFLSEAGGISAGGDFRPKGQVKKANVIRAIAADSRGNISPVSNATYFVGIDKYPVPVISLKTDTSNLFNKETGIYVLGSTYDNWVKEQTGNFEPWQAQGNYSMRGREWERPVNFEFIDGDTVFEQDCGIRIMGAASRSATQKSFRLTARTDYGEKNFKFPLIPDNERSDGNGNVDKYRSFVLRNGGNDHEFANIRDPLLQDLATGGDFETMQHTPVVVFLDGEYWGAYTLAEDYSDHYIENNYSTDKDDAFDDNNIIFLKKGGIEDGKEEDIELYNEMFDFITSNDMSNAANYEKASTMLDIHSYADYLAVSLYICNHDAYYDNNNWAMWRVRETGDAEKADGRWRMMVYDIDFSSGIYDGNDVNINSIRQMLDKKPSDINEDGDPIRDPVKMIHSLLENKDFRNELVNSLCDMRNISFERGRAVDHLLEMYDVYAKLIPDTLERFGPEWVLHGGADKHFDDQINGLAAFLDSRYDKFPKMIGDAFDLGNTAEIRISYDDSKGKVYVNGKAVPSDFKGIYFADIPISVTCTANNGSEGKKALQGCREENGKIRVSDGAVINVTF